MNQDNQALPVIPNAPGLWWINQPGFEKPQIAEVKLRSGEWCVYFFNGGYNWLNQIPESRWLGPVTTFAESEANRKALVESRRVLEAIRQFAIIHRGKPSVIDFGAALTQIERACIKALELP